MSFEVLRPGALSTVQDLGRFGLQHLGVPVSGAMDDWSHRLANALLGNEDDAATLEMTLTGPTLAVERTCLLAACGADLSASVSGPGGVEPLPLGRPCWIRAGARLEFGAARSGVRAYLALRGGFDLPPSLGSRSTYLRGGFGGLAGRALRRGDHLVGLGPVPDGRRLDRPPDGSQFARSLSGALLLPTVPLVVPAVRPAQIETLRVIDGAQRSIFTEASVARLFQSEYRVSPQSDRMGYRLEGPPLERSESIEMISEAVTSGTIQVPPDGLPIILMADRQTSGGYPKVGDVAGADLRMLAQLGPGSRLRLARIALADAERVLLARERELSHVRWILSVAAARREGLTAAQAQALQADRGLLSPRRPDSPRRPASPRKPPRSRTSSR